MCNFSKLTLLVAVGTGVKGTATWLFLISLPETRISDYACSVPFVLLPGSWHSLRFSGCSENNNENPDSNFPVKVSQEGPGQCGSVAWSVIPCSRWLRVRFLIRARTWVVGSVPSWISYGRQPNNVSLSLSCSVSPINKHFEN